MAAGGVSHRDLTRALPGGALRCGVRPPPGARRRTHVGSARETGRVGHDGPRRLPRAPRRCARDRRRNQHLSRPREAGDAGGEIHRETFYARTRAVALGAGSLADLPHVHAGAQARQIRRFAVGSLELQREDDRSAGGLKGQKATVPGSVDDAAAGLRGEAAHQRAMPFDQIAHNVIAASRLQRR